MSRQFYRTYPNASALRSQFKWTQYKLYLPSAEQLMDEVEEARQDFDRQQQEKGGE